MFLFQLFSEITPPDTVIPIADNPTDNVVMLLNFILRIIFFIAGLLALWNFISAGFKLIGSSGDPKALEAAQGKFVWTFIGIAVMVFSIVVAGIIGITVYGEWDAIINPQFVTP
jgi:hypothetical protein